MGWGLFRSSRWLLFACALCTVGTICFIAGVLDHSAVVMGIGFAISEMGATIAGIAIGVALCEMYDIKMTALVVCFGYAIACVLDTALPFFDAYARYALFALLPCAEILLVNRLVRGISIYSSVRAILQNMR